MKTPVPTRGSPPRKRPADENAKPPIGYVSPTKRVQTAVASRTHKRVLASADNLKASMKNNDVTKASVVAGVMVTARVMWTSFDDCATRPVARLHLIDKQAIDTLEEMHATLRDNYKHDKMQVDAELITASVYGATEKTKGLPNDGEVVSLRDVWKLNLFNNQAVQLNTKVESIRVEADAVL